MGSTRTVATNEIDEQGGRLAHRLRSLRQERGWSLEVLAERSGVSRATLSRIENGEVSPTANALGRLGAAFQLTTSRLLMLAEEDFEPLVSRSAQPIWNSPDAKFTRRSVSPPSARLHGEVLGCELQPDTTIDYEAPPRKGFEHHLVLLKGWLGITVDGQAHLLKAGDCLRYQLSGPSQFRTPPHAGARYLLFIL